LCEDMICNGFKEGVKYLVLLALTSRKREVLAITEYFLRGGLGDVSVIAQKYGFGKYALRGYIQRLVRKLGHDPMRKFRMLNDSGIIDKVLSLNPIIVYFPNSFYPYYCLLCNMRIYSRFGVSSHITRKHGDYVDKVVRELLQNLRI